MFERITSRREFFGDIAALTILGSGCSTVSLKSNPSQMPSTLQEQPVPPLTETHYHTDCAHRAESIHLRADEFQIPAFQGKTVEEIRSIITLPASEAIMPARNPEEAMQKWNKWYERLKETRKAYTSPKVIALLIRDVVEDSANSGVGLIELRLSLLSTVDTLLNNLGIKDAPPEVFWRYAIEVFDALIEALKDAPIPTDLIMSISCQNRYKPKVADLIKFCIDYRKHLIGLDLTNEKDNPASAYAPEIERARGDIKFLTIHCMELMGPERGWDALTLNPDRIGHGIRAIEDPKLVEELARRGIPLEMCVRSNVVTGAVIGGIDQHPMPKLYDAGVKLVVGSDGCNDGSTLADNYSLIEKSFGFTPEQMRKLRENSFKYAFRNLKTK
jgi:adenosine deaminase